MNKLQPSRDLEILEVKGYRGTTFPTWLGSRSYHNLTTLGLINCQNSWRIPALGQLPALTSLTIERLQSVVAVGSEIFKADDCASLVPFPSLESLYFGNMTSWELWLSIDPEAFPKLRTLRFDDCPKLIGNLPPQLLSVRRLEIIGCTQLASSIPKSPKIHELSIIGSRHVALQEQELPPSLRRLTLSSEQMLEPLSKKLHIQDLYVQDCSDDDPLLVIHMPTSVKMLFITDCENLMFELVSQDPLVQLQRISINNCKSVTYLSDDMELLPNLKELCIEECPEMEPFSPPWSLPSSLKQLEIRNCDKLLSCHTQWHHLIPTITTLRISNLSHTWHCIGLQHLTSFQLLQILDSPKLRT